VRIRRCCEVWRLYGDLENLAGARDATLSIYG
jgi:hypothetical protein